jgi:hypothetical protein
MKRGLWLLVLLLSICFVLAGCGGGDKAPAKTPAADAAMDDALALLPGDAIAVGTIDARAFFGSPSFGAELAKLVEKSLPLGPEAGFQASRDVDRVTWASYAYQGIDAAAVVVGRFDEAKIKQVAAQQTPPKNGGMLVVSQYAGRDVYTVNNVGFTILSPTKVVAGSESGIRRVLERIRDRRVKRDIAPWMIETIETPGAAAAFAADLAAHPMPAEVTRQIPVPFLQATKAVRLLVAFKESGLQTAGSFTYADMQTAQSSSEQIKQAATMSKWLALFGIKIQNVDVKVDNQDVQVKLEVDDQSLRKVLAQAPQWLNP